MADNWGLGGVQLSYGWALALCHHVGFRGKDLTRAVAIMTAESGRWTEAWHRNYPGTTQESTDRGLFQINSKFHVDLADDEAFKPIPNAAYAYKISSGRHFTPWAAYNSGAYLKYMPLVWATRVLGRWHKKTYHVEEQYG